jgi:hypothetical protein
MRKLMFRLNSRIDPGLPSRLLSTQQAWRKQRSKARPGHFYFFAIKSTSDQHRFTMPISGDDPRNEIPSGPRLRAETGVGFVA